MTITEFVSEADYAGLVEKIEAANRKGKAFQAVRYEPDSDRIALELSNGAELLIPVATISELAKVPKDQLVEIKLSPSGHALYLSSADVHIGVNELLRDIFAALPSGVLASHFGRVGGSMTSTKKRATSSENGKLGGRPKKETPKPATP